ncbi:MAG TPA: polyphosphate kinase 1 [Phycisphaerales bacterium]|nr:polyphosphate kinase 1 [Phycisphaerales bacterium]|tara:strand:- start:40853 stop:43021 length:2169 start_codon:yes stop_codon:yes gene_type:complete
MNDTVDENTPISDLPNEVLFLNREASWLEFNRRVLHEALDERTPLLERVAFLAIFNSNLDEFFQKRVGGLKRQINAGVTTRTVDGLTAQEQLALIRSMVLEDLQTQADCFEQKVKPALAEEGIHLLKWDELTEEEKQFTDDYFEANLFPVLTPLAVDPGHPFPFISNLSTSLGVILRYPDGVSRHDDAETGEIQFARVKVPRMLPRWVKLGEGGENYRFIHLEDLIYQYLDRLFEGMIIEDAMPFRISRNADVERDEEDAEDLLELVEQELRERRFAKVIRLEVPTNPNEKMVRFLIEELELEESDVYIMPSELDFTDLWLINGLGIPKLSNKPWSPQTPVRLTDTEADIFSIIRGGDILVHHPYESFSSSVERFIAAAARDPKVVAIKLTLYRTAKDSPFIPQLIRAAEEGKQVVVLVELSARFDEERNVQLAQTLEKAGIHVVYGLVGLKTHTKTALVVRQETEGMRSYCHIGTGNYNSKTANLYTDLGLFTCKPHITGELTQVFHFLTGRSLKRDFKHLLVAPINMKRRFYELIDREITHTVAWKERGGDPNDPNRPRIIAKMNSLEDRGICRKLYEASRAGVKIDLNVRGFCCLKPGVPGLSDNIKLISVIGRFLEHERIYHFHNDGNPQYFIGSADWMYRNLNNRVECITPIEEPSLQKKLWHILETLFNDHRQAWDMDANGKYTQRVPQDESQEIGTHDILMDATRREILGITGKA